MDIAQIIELLNNDLRNEWKHLRFYLTHASSISGPHAEEYKEVFLEEAASEMRHVTEFSDLIYGLGGVATSESNDFPVFTSVLDALGYAYEMETEVVKNYVERIAQAGYLPEPDATWLIVFLEDQVNHSRRDADRYKRLLGLTAAHNV